MTGVLLGVHGVIEGVVFGNGWLALAGVGVTVGITVAVRVSRGITV